MGPLGHGKHKGAFQARGIWVVELLVHGSDGELVSDARLDFDVLDFERSEDVGSWHGPVRTWPRRRQRVWWNRTGPPGGVLDANDSRPARQVSRSHSTEQ